MSKFGEAMRGLTVFISDIRNCKLVRVCVRERGGKRGRDRKRERKRKKERGGWVRGESGREIEREGGDSMF